MDDIEEGKDADQELCLLPDEDREISEQEKEQAIAYQQEAENEDREQAEGSTDWPNAEENGKLCQVC